jgi:phospholipid/cholesterol/gamma-HCH transport system substrate-binding protein
MKRPSIKPFREMDPVPIGIVFLSVMAALLLLSFNLDRLPFSSGTSYSAAFARASGLRSGDRVMIGGVVVGKVDSVGLEGTHVKVGFRVSHGGVHLGRDTSATIEIATLLGNKYLALHPAGPGRWPSHLELPLTHTQSPYDVAPALEDVGRTVGRIDTTQLAAALDTLATTFRNSPASLRSMLSGLSRLSTTVASRDAELTTLLQHTRTLTDVLAQRRQDFVGIFGDGDQLLQMLEQRRQVVDELLQNTSDMAQQLTGLVHDNQRTIAPTLAHLHGVLTMLNDQQANLDLIVRELYVFVRGEVDATGSGPWFDGTAINATNPFQLNGNTRVYPASPRTLGDLLRVP